MVIPLVASKDDDWTVIYCPRTKTYCPGTIVGSPEVWAIEILLTAGILLTTGIDLILE